MKQDKYLDGEGGAVAPHQAAMDVVRRNALPKLTDRCPNLVVVVDDLKVTPVGLPGLAGFVLREFVKPDHDPGDPEDVVTYERLGGVLFLHLEPESGQRIYYYADFVQNPGALAACALPQAVAGLLSEMREESWLRRKQRFAAHPSIFDVITPGADSPDARVRFHPGELRCSGSDPAGGIYQLEGGGWRWMSQRGVVLLKAPAAPAPLRVVLFIPDQAPARRVRVAVDGATVAEQVYSAPGAYILLSAPVTVAGGSATVAITVDKTLTVPGDHRRLGVILGEVGFVP